MQTGIQVLLVVTAAFIAAGCNWIAENPNRDIKREKDGKDGKGIVLYTDEPTGMIHDDPYGADVAKWYKQNYIYWTNDHDHLVKMVEKRNIRGIESTVEDIKRDIGGMQRALDPEGQAALAEIVKEYESIAERASRSYIPNSVKSALRKLKRRMWREFEPGKIELIVPEESGD